MQVLCNSLPASILIAIHAYSLASTNARLESSCLPHPVYSQSKSSSLQFLANALPYGVIANYASAAADTFSSELGILSSTPPFLITDVVGLFGFSPKRVPRGTNGGVTVAGLVAGFAGAALLALVAAVGVPVCNAGRLGSSDWTFFDRGAFGGAVAVWGALGSILDSVLGALLQASIVDTRTGKVIEGQGGGKVLFNKAASNAKTTATGRRVVSGNDILSNNGVNLLMLSIMSFGAVMTAWALQNVA